MVAFVVFFTAFFGLMAAGGVVMLLWEEYQTYKFEQRLYDRGYLPAQVADELLKRSIRKRTSKN